MVWIILAIIFTILLLLLNLYVKIHLKYIDEELYIAVKLLFFKYVLIPDIEKADVKIKKKPKGKKAPVKKKKLKSSFEDIMDLISGIKTASEKVSHYFDRYLRVDIKAFRIKVASNDAASTAILYGLVSQGVSYVMEILTHNIKKVKIKNKDSILVVADFLSDEFETQIDIKFKIRSWQTIVLGINSFKDFIVNFNNKI